MESLTLGQWPPCPTPFNLAAHVLAAGASRPDRLALAVIRPEAAERWSHGRLAAAVRGAGAGLLAEGLQPGDRILLRLGNSPRFPVAYLGAIAAGLVPVASFAGATVPEVTRMAQAIAPVAAVLADDGLALPDAGLGLRLIPASRLAAWEALPPCPWHMGSPDRPAYAVFTSGSSGQPMPVLHAHRAIWARGMMHQGWEGLGPEDRMLHAGAFNWTYTLGTGLLDPWTMGASALVPGEGVAPEQLALLARRFDATILAAVPGVIRRMLRAALPRLCHGLSAGEKLDPALRAAWQAATGTDLHEALGMSEVSTYLSSCPARPAPMGAAGYAQPGRRLAILDAHGRPVPRGTPGQIGIGAEDPGLCLPFPALTHDRVQDGWFLTGDLAVMAADGAITTLGRADDLMNAGGYRVAPAEVEAALSGLPGLAELAVCAIATPSGATIIAALYSGSALPGELEARAAALSPYKRPRHWQRIDHLPRNANGKIDRKALPALIRLAASP